MRSHVGVADTRQIECVGHRQHRHVHEELPEDDADVPESHWSSPREENQGHHEVEGVEENRPENVETGEGPYRALLTPLVLKLSVSHAAFTDLACTNLLD